MTDVLLVSGRLVGAYVAYVVLHAIHTLGRAPTWRVLTIWQENPEISV